MILIDYEIKSSDIHGAGMFTKQSIKKGELIAKASPVLDVDITVEQFNKLEKKKNKNYYIGDFMMPQEMFIIVILITLNLLIILKMVI